MYTYIYTRLYYYPTVAEEEATLDELGRTNIVAVPRGRI